MLNSKLFLSSLLLIAIAATTILVGNACRNRARTGSDEAEKVLGSEPDEYSATTIRTVVDGSIQQAVVTREARSGELRREEWTEQGHHRAFILRADLGKTYLLDLDREAYVETMLDGGNEGLSSNSQSQDRADGDSTSRLVQEVDRAIEDAPLPDHVETRELSSTEIEGHSCKVYEQRASFPDGHIEITKTFRATDLRGVVLRAESYSEPPLVRVITERKDISLDVSADAFTVPASFKKVDKLDH